MSAGILPVASEALLGFAGLGSVELLCCVGIALIFGVLGTVFWVWMLIDCVTKEADTGNTKVAWTLVIALAHWVGAVIYYFARRPQRFRELGR